MTLCYIHQESFHRKAVDPYLFISALYTTQNENRYAITSISNDLLRDYLKHLTHGKEICFYNHFYCYVEINKIFLLSLGICTVLIGVGLPFMTLGGLAQIGGKNGILSGLFTDFSKS